jgi:hypothetical protein
MLLGYVGSLKEVLSTACFGGSVWAEGLLVSLGKGLFSLSFVWPFFLFCFDDGSFPSSVASPSVASVPVVSLTSVDVASAAFDCSLFFLPFCFFLSVSLEPSPAAFFASSLIMALRILRPFTQSLQSHVSWGRASLAAEESSESDSFLHVCDGLGFIPVLCFFLPTRTSSSDVSLSSIADDSSLSVVTSSSEVSSTSVSEDSLGLIACFLSADLSGLRLPSKLTFFRDEDGCEVRCSADLPPLRRPG